MTRHGKARQENKRQDKARQGKARQGKTSEDKTRQRKITLVKKKQNKTRGETKVEERSGSRKGG